MDINEIIEGLETKEIMVEGEGFEPSYSYEGRFTVCCL